MDFLNKKTLVGIIIIILLINAIGLGIFYYINIYVPSDVLFKTSEECLEETKAMSDDELIDEIENFKNSDKISVSTKEDLLGPLYRNSINYLICKVEYDKSEENYIRAKSFMESLAYTSEQNKQSVLDRLEKTYLNKTLINKFYSIKTLVFDSIELICEGDVVRDGFLDTSKKFWEEELSLERVKELEDETNKVCSVINKYIDDPLTSFVENEIKGKWPNDRLMENKLVLQHSALARSSIAFRIGGVELAQEVCDYISDTVIEIKEWCKKNVYIINNIEKCMVSTGEKFEECVAKEKETCGEYKKSIANSICVET